ncbi:MAG: hypothetical protein A2Y33_14180 [Spirochaetes bacterium GWF1_51_8]|nr:MAG: hypothetical protein A2Y33_14180 [Spirochaetes bacterium GWF1_51_8]
MTDEDRINLIRQGNELFNRGDHRNALKIFLATDYRDGIIRVADHLYYEEKQQVSAIKLYKKAGYQRKVDEFAEKAALTIHMLLEGDKKAAEVQAEKIESTEASQANFKEWKPVTLSMEDIVGSSKSKSQGTDKKNGKK